MQHGSLRSVKSLSPVHEVLGGHEPVTSVGLFTRRSRFQGYTLVFGRQTRCDRLRNHRLRFANNFFILTCDLGFGAILAATRQAVPSVVQIRAEDVSPEAVGPQTIAALLHLTAQLKAGALLTIETDRTRLRLLPLKPEE